MQWTLAGRREGAKIQNEFTYAYLHLKQATSTFVEKLWGNETTVIFSGRSRWYKKSRKYCKGGPSSQKWMDMELRATVQTNYEKKGSDEKEKNEAHVLGSVVGILSRNFSRLLRLFLLQCSQKGLEKMENFPSFSVCVGCWRLKLNGVIE